MPTSLLRKLPFFALLLASFPACDSSPAGTGGTGGGGGTTATTSSDTLAIPADPDCDPLVPEVCAMPFPSSRWLKPDPARATGYTLSFGPTTLPANKKGVHLDPAPYSRLDGYGLGVPAVAFLSGLDGGDLPGEEHIPDSLTPEARVLMFEVQGTSLTRIPCFAELDAHAKEDEERSIIVRPAVLLKEGTRYVVALRGLKRTDGSEAPPSDAFRALRDELATGTPVEDRIPLYEELFGMLAEAGVPRADLQLAWDWTTASHEALHDPLLHMRDEAFAQLGDQSPGITITSIETFTEADNADIAHEVLGTFDVPDYTVKTTLGPHDAYLLNWGPDGLPVQTGVYKAEFRARIPRSAASGEPHGVLMHGHGLNGSHGQIRASHIDQLINKEKLVVVGCNMIGMSSEDVDVILEMLNDLSGFPHLADRLHQGVLDHAFLMRAMKLGFDKIPEIAATGLVIDQDSLFYRGISQGGIFGATHMAMSLDIPRGHLGVPGNNYSTLLQRSVDFNPFFVLLGFSYPDAREQQVLLGAIQTLWDRTDPVSHYRHISADPHPGTPPHQVLLASAKGDWQVALLTNEIAARSDAGVALLPGYGREVSLVTPTPYPHQGSGLVNYDFGNPWPPPGNKPPQDDVGDPHGKPTSVAAHQTQMMHFLRTGEIIDTCGGDGCTPD